MCCRCTWLDREPCERTVARGRRRRTREGALVETRDRIGRKDRIGAHRFRVGRTDRTTGIRAARRSRRRSYPGIGRRRSVLCPRYARATRTPGGPGILVSPLRRNLRRAGNALANLVRRCFARTAADDEILRRTHSYDRVAEDERLFAVHGARIRRSEEPAAGAAQTVSRPHSCTTSMPTPRASTLRLSPNSRRSRTCTRRSNTRNIRRSPRRRTAIS